MSVPNEPVTLSAEEVRELTRKFAALRHDVNNNLSLVTAAAELIRRRPETAERMWDTLAEQPHKVIEIITQFSRDLDAALRITKP
jgi:aspartokinase